MGDDERGAGLDDSRASALFGSLKTFPRLLLAVSGGPDSIALMGLAASAASALPDLHVATVHHGLRAEAQAECHQVARLAKHFGLPWTQLDWTGEKPGSGIQNAAREARYRLLRDHALSIGAPCIVTAHHRDDQAETVLMRLAAGSGIAGLAGMASETDLGSGLQLARPLLGTTKAELIATCEARGWPYVDDPSNYDPAYGRSRARALIPVLAAQGLSATRLSKLAERAGRADAALDAIATQRWQEIGGSCLAVGGRLPASRLFDQPDELALRLLERAIRAVVAAHALPAVYERLERLERLLAELRGAFAARKPLARTLRGVLIRLSEAGNLRFTPAPPRSHVKDDGANPPQFGA